MKSPTDDINIFTPEEVASATPSDLPPPGYQRDETLAARSDELDQKAEAIFGNMGTIDPALLQPNHNIQSELARDGLEVSNSDPAYEYCWANYVSHQAYQVYARKDSGWEVVSGNMLECSHFRKEDGTRRKGDVLLMRMRKDFHLKMTMKNDRKRLRQQFGVEAELRDIAGKHPDAFPAVHTPTDGDPRILASVAQRGQNHSPASRVAGKHLDSMLRAGNVPGLGTPRGGA